MLAPEKPIPDKATGMRRAAHRRARCYGNVIGFALRKRRRRYNSRAILSTERHKQRTQEEEKHSQARKKQGGAEPVFQEGERGRVQCLSPTRSSNDDVKPHVEL